MSIADFQFLIGRPGKISDSAAHKQLAIGNQKSAM